MERNKKAGLGVDMNFDNEVILTKTSGQKMVRKSDLKKLSDASFQVWGSVALDSTVYAKGRWNYQETKRSINYLELLAIRYAIQSLYGKDRQVHIEIQPDNISAIKYINDMWGLVGGGGAKGVREGNSLRGYGFIS